MPKSTSTVAHFTDLRDALTDLEGRINKLKAERDTHVKEHRAVYEKERKYADKIKALQEQVTPIWAELKQARDLLAGKV